MREDLSVTLSEKKAELIEFAYYLKNRSSFKRHDIELSL